MLATVQFRIFLSFCFSKNVGVKPGLSH